MGERAPLGSNRTGGAPLPRIVLITDWSVPDLLHRVERCLSFGAALAIQHRHPDCAARAFFEEARSLSSLLAGTGCSLFINGRLDVAVALDCHLHLPARGLPVADARACLPPASRLSVAVHDEREADQAAGADFALVSPVFSPGSKPGDTRPPLGPEGFARLAERTNCPAFALGGIDEVSAHLLPPQAAGLALVSAAWRAPEPERLLRILLSRWTG